jgi:hypothetical protein
MSSKSAAVGAAAPSAPKAATKPLVIDMTISRKHTGSLRYDINKGTEGAVDNLYVNKTAISDALLNGDIVRPAQGQLPGKVRVSIEVLDWVDGVTVPTAEEFKERRELAKAAKEKKQAEL